MANPLVRPHLRFYPEEAGNKLNQTWQADRWLKDMDPDNLTPMIRITSPTLVATQDRIFEDFFVFEPIYLRDGSACIVERWFTREGSNDFFWQSPSLEARP